MKRSKRPTPRKKKPEAPVGEALSGEAYLYGVIAGIDAKRLAAMQKKSGQAGLKIVGHKKIAALVSEAHAAVKPDLKTHEAVLHAVAAMTTVLPARYGSVFGDGLSLVTRLLAPRHRALQSSLKKLKGAVEVSLTVSFVPEEFLRAVVTAYPELARQASGNIVYKARMEAGQRIGELLSEMKERQAAALLRELKPFIRDQHKGQLIGELMILNSILLVERSKMGRFRKILAGLDRKAAGRLSIHCTEARLPYSFVDLRGE